MLGFAPEERAQQCDHAGAPPLLVVPPHLPRPHWSHTGPAPALGSDIWPHGMSSIPMASQSFPNSCSAGPSRQCSNTPVGTDRSHYVSGSECSELDQPPGKAWDLAQTPRDPNLVWSVAPETSGLTPTPRPQPFPDSCAAEPRLVAFDDLLPNALRRIGALEQVVIGQQTQINELVPIQRDVLAMYSALTTQQAMVIERQSVLQQSHEALCEDHEALCSCLWKGGLIKLDGIAEACNDSSSESPMFKVFADVGLANMIGVAAGIPQRLLSMHQPSFLRRQSLLALWSIRFGGWHGVSSNLRKGTIEVCGPETSQDQTSYGALRTRRRPATMPAWGPGLPASKERSPAPPQQDIFIVGGYEVSRSSSHCNTSQLEARHPVSTLERFDAKNGLWEPCAPMTTARMDHRGVVMAGDIYIVGGSDGEQALASCERFVPRYGVWTPLQPMRQARKDHDVAVLAGALHVTGGASTDDSRLSRCESFDPGAGHWDPLPPMSVGRRGHQSVPLMEKLYVIGGEDESKGSQPNCERYDPFGGNWEPLKEVPGNPGPGHTLSAAAVHGKLYVVASTLSRRAAAVCQRFDPRFDRWEWLRPNEFLHCCAAATEVAGKLYTFGRLSHQAEFAMCQCFDPSSGQWEQLPRANAGLASCKTLSAAGGLYIIGVGADDVEQQVGESPCLIQRFDLMARRWEPLPQLKHAGVAAVAITSAS